MRIRLLGPVEVEASGRALDVGPRQRRAVLAALAMDAGTPVSIDTLAERVWGPAAPEAPRSALYAHVTRLRQVLSPPGEQVTLDRQGDGYVLAVDRRMVDLHELAGLAEAGRSAPGPGEGEHRAQALRAAMDLWRGSPLAGLTGDWAARVRRGVESQLIGVATGWAAEELRIGNAEVVADRLAAVVSDHPLAEPLVALQMRALCALGRVGEALRCYAQTRAQLAEEFGAEPGAELQELHLAVLRGQLDGMPAVPLPAPPDRLVPQQLPADAGRLIGRDRHTGPVLTRLGRRADGHPAPVITLCGPSGAGKSALASHCAHRLRPDYPDGQLYLDLRGNDARSDPLTPDEALARLLRALGPGGGTGHRPGHTDEAAAAFRSRVADRRLLIVLDNAADAAQVRPLLPGGPGCGVLVTSRQSLAGLGDVHQVRVGALSSRHAVALLAQGVGEDRVKAEPDAAAAIAQWCEHLPLALRIAVTRLVARPAWPLAELSARLADEYRRLDNLECDGAGVRTVFDGSYLRLRASPDVVARSAAEAFELLGAHGTRVIDRPGAARLLGCSESYAEKLLERLVDAQLLETSAPGLYRMSDLLRLYARERRELRQQEAAKFGILT